MNHYRILLLAIILLCLGTSQTTAQSELAIGEWQSHLPYFNVDHVEQSAEKVFLATAESVLIYDKEDTSIEFLSKINGLSETGIQDMVYDEMNNQLIVAYSNSVFDIVAEDGIFSITDINDKADIVGDKQIYDLHVQNGEFLYLATGFGLVQFDLLSLEFGFTMDISQRVSKVSGSEEDLIIATEGGAYTLNLGETSTPGFFNEWSLVTDGLPDAYEAADVFLQNDQTIITTADQVYVSQSGGSYDSLYTNPFPDFEIIFINPAPQGWLLGLRHKPSNSGSFPGQGKLLMYNNNLEQIGFADNCFRNIEDASIDAAGRVFTTEIWDGLFYRESFNGPCLELEINSPFSNEATDIDIFRDEVYVASGGVRDNFGDQFSRNGFYIYKDNAWTNVNERFYSFLKDNDVIQIYKVAVSPDGSKVYLASFWAGLLEYDTETEEMILYDETNSPLQKLVGDSRVRISGLTFDNEGKLWISNFGAPQPIASLSPEGEWAVYDIQASDDKVTNIAVDDSGLVWVVIGGTQGGLVVLNPEDRSQRAFGQNNSEIPSNFVNDVAVDQDGAVWVGTGEGAVVFECGFSATEESCTGNRRKVLVDNILANLLESEDVLSIAIDGANRKWFGTRNGIFVQSPDGETQIAQYDENNSPLFDNVVRAMAFNEISGEMFIATDNGIQAIRTETTGATNSHAAQVIAFPNPVRPEYRGPIAIKGLARDAEVRITDIDGKLVHKSNALGGQAIWDGQNLEGQEVASGVYLVFSSSTDLFRDISTNVAKILIVR